MASLGLVRDYYFCQSYHFFSLWNTLRFTKGLDWYKQSVHMELDITILTHEYTDTRRMRVLDSLSVASTKPYSSTVDQL